MTATATAATTTTLRTWTKVAKFVSELCVEALIEAHRFDVAAI
jgi:hypothetical protein